MKSTPTLHMWHDYVCPFCNVEATRLARIKEEEKLDLAVRFHPWPLEVANGRQPRAEDEDQWAQSAGSDAELLGICGIPTLVLPGGSMMRAPGFKIERSAERRSIRDDLDALRDLLRQVASAASVATGHA